MFVCKYLLYYLTTYVENNNFTINNIYICIISKRYTLIAQLLRTNYNRLIERQKSFAFRFPIEHYGGAVLYETPKYLILTELSKS